MSFFLFSTCPMEKEPCLENKTLHYYEHVTWVLVLQSITCIIPRLILGLLENGKLRRVIGKKHETKSVEFITEYMIQNRGSHFWYSVHHVACDLMFIAIFVMNIIFTQSFINLKWFENIPGHRIFYGSLWKFQENFPTTTFCLFGKYTPQKTWVTTEVFCILSFNNRIKYAYIGIYQLFWILAIVSAITIIWKILTLFRFVQVLDICLQGGKNLKKGNIEKAISQKLTFLESYGNYFILTNICKELEPQDVTFLINSLIEKEEPSLEKSGKTTSHSCSTWSIKKIICLPMCCESTFIAKICKGKQKL